jgi:hypothetical protein
MAMSLGTRKNYNIANSLQKKGFEEKQSSHTRLIYYIDGKKTSIVTFISHGKKEISDELMHKMARQINLSYKQFCDVVDCPMTKEALREFYLDEGIVKL